MRVYDPNAKLVSVVKTLSKKKTRPMWHADGYVVYATKNEKKILTL